MWSPNFCCIFWVYAVIHALCSCASAYADALEHTANFVCIYGCVCKSRIHAHGTTWHSTSEGDEPDAATIDRPENAAATQRGLATGTVVATFLLYDVVCPRTPVVLLPVLSS